MERALNAMLDAEDPSSLPLYILSQDLLRSLRQTWKKMAIRVYGLKASAAA